MRPDARQHVWAIYAWCRRTDDIVDSPRALLNRDVLTNDLQDWDKRLDGIWNGQPRDLFDLAMVDSLKAYPRLSIQPFRDMIAGMVMDVPGLGKDRYQVTHTPSWNTTIIIYSPYTTIIMCPPLTSNCSFTLTPLLATPSN